MWGMTFQSMDAIVGIQPGIGIGTSQGGFYGGFKSV